jgi:hypothetical protein
MSFAVSEGDRFVMLDYWGNPLDTWQVIHSVVMPSGRRRTTVFNVNQPADMFDIYAVDLLDPFRFRSIDDLGRRRTGTLAA